MRAQIVTAAVLGTLLTSVPLDAHHSISTYYHRNERVTVEGVVIDVLLRNPHARIRMEATDESGGSDVWTLELDDPGDLQEQGIFSNTIRAGDEIVVTGNPARDGSAALFVQTLRRPADGLNYRDD